MQKKITFQWGTEKQIKVSSAGHPDSLFYESYRQALAGVAEVVRASIQYTDGYDPFMQSQNPYRETGNCMNERSDYYPQNDKIFYNYPSNLIVFAGERGAGKSSALLTFVDSLKDTSSGMYTTAFLDDMVICELPGASSKNVTQMLLNAFFCPLPPIDPTTLGSDGQILTVILSKIFQLAKKRWERLEEGGFGEVKNKQELINQKNDLLNRFKTCYDHICALRNLNGSNFETDGLDMLDSLGDTVYLKQELADLVAQTLQFCYPRENRPFLVLQVDDTDMNICWAHSILEDIRKYLVIPRVIVVMAADILHLTKIVEREFLKDERSNASEGEQLARSLANQYITKLFPYTRQIWLPALGVYLKEHADNVIITYEVLGKAVLPDGSQIFPDSQEQIFRLIYRKTGMIFLKHKNRLHYIIPDNMRLLSHLLAMLSQMSDVADPDSEQYSLFLSDEAPPTGDRIRQHLLKLQTRLQNVQRFRDYFLNVWVNNNLDPEDGQVIHQLDKTNLDSKVNFIFAMFYPMSGEDRENIDYAVLLNVLDNAEDGSSKEAEKKCLFAIRLYFSFLGHCLALEEAISYFEKCVNAENDAYKDGECTFISLYPIFGSFIYTNQVIDDLGVWTERKNVTVYWQDNTRGGDSTESECLNLSWTPSYKRIRRKVRFNPEDRIMGYLLSMLMDYEGDSEKGKNYADLCACILNCLYIKRSNLVSRHSKNVVNGATLVVEDGRELKWENVQSSALMIVLNWDVQRQIRAELIRMLKNEGRGSAYFRPDNFFEQLTAMRSFYVSLTDCFRDKLRDPSVVNPRESPIYCLETMDFSTWLNPLFRYSGVTLGDEESGDDVHKTVCKFFGLPVPSENEPEDGRFEKYRNL